jgi:predicted Zn finger-like uncharacterized protein
MRFSCKKCNAKYAIADEKIRGKVVKVRCKHCGQVMVVRGSERSSVEVSRSDEPPSNQIDDQSPQPDAGIGKVFEQAFKGLYESGQQQTIPTAKGDPQAGTEPATKEPGWYYGLDGTEAGPFTSLEMEERIRAGSITRDHFVWREGMGDWTPVEKAFSQTAFLQPTLPDQQAFREGKIPSETGDVQKPGESGAIVDELRKQARERQEKRERRNQASIQALDDRDSYTASKEAFTDDQGQQHAEQQLTQAKAPLEDVLVDKIALLRDDLAKEPVTAVSPTSELSTGEHKIRQASAHFFESGETYTPPSELLPPRPVVDAEQAAAALHAESLKEELADSIAPVVEAEHPSSDSVIIRQAGVHSTGRRISMALIGVLFVVMVAGGTLALVLRKDLIGGSHLDPIKPGEETLLVKDGRATKNDDLSLEDTKKIRSLLEGEDSKVFLGSKPSPELPKPLPTTTMRGLILPDDEQNVCDIGAGENHQHARSRVQKGDIGVATAPDISMANDVKIGELRGKKVETAPLPPDRQIGPEKLTDLQIHMVIQKYYAQVKSCQQRQLQRDSSIAGKMIVVARVRPNGSVETVRVDTPSFRGSFVEECLIKEIKNWLFPSVKGETYDVPFQLQLMARE